VDAAAEIRVGPYILLGRLGSGGMGEVYLGRDTRLDRKVALKCLLASQNDGEEHARILHEARAAAQINHGNVATIHDVIDEGSRAYIVMEYVEGQNLAARLRRGRIPLRDVVSIGRQLASALAAAHAVRVIHRDLKPANIQLTGAGVVKVLDFGVASAGRPILVSPTAATKSAPAETDPKGRRAGTPAYMSPEQMLGLPTDHRADLYSLGVVLFELAAGRRPYEYVDALELVQMPGSLAPRADEVDTGVPTFFADVLATALRCDREQRFQSAGEFDAALTAVQKRLDVTRRPTRREWLALAAVGATGVAGSLALPMLGRREGPGGRAIHSIAVLPFVNLSGDLAQEYFVDGMTDGLINALCRISAIRVKARTSVMAFKGSKKSIAEIARELRVDAIVEGSALLTSKGAETVRIAVNVIDAATQTQLWGTALERTLPSILTMHLELARAIAENIHVAVTSDERRRLAAGGQPVDPETYKLYLLGRQEWMGRTVPQLQRALKYFREATSRSPNYALAYAGLADTYVLLTGDFGVLPRDEGAAETIAHASRALALDPGLSEAYTSLAFANFFLLWDFAAAGQQFHKALELNPNYATARHWYGNYLSDMGKEEDALAELRRALDLDPFSSIISRDVAWPLFFSRRYDEAIAQLDLTLAAFPGYMPAERLRARAFAMRGDTAEAIRQFEQQKLRVDNARARCELAWAYALAGRREDASAELQSALALATGVYPYDIALVHAALNQPNAALAALERAFQERDSTMVNLRHDPRLDSVRADTRYQRLVEQMRFPQL
jgi:eukaryotic-like serine/threonine-protein kinase